MQQLSLPPIVVGFPAGCLATLVFHQAAVALLWWLGIAPFPPFMMVATAPMGVPAVISLAFWGGVWGIPFALVQYRFPHGVGYWLTSVVFGAVLPSLVALLVVVPLKGGAVGAGWQRGIWVFAALVNGAWRLGTALLYRLGIRFWR